MVSVGASIKERREEKKISLNTVAKNLHISIDFLESIESDNFSAIPGSAYTIGYIRSYCNFLDLDADAIVMLYKDQINYSNKKQSLKIQKPIEIFNPLISYKLISFFSIASLSLAFYFLFINEKINYPNFAITPDISENLQYQIEEIELENALINLKKEKMKLLETQSENLSRYENDFFDDNENLLNNISSDKVIAALPSDTNDQNLKNLITIKAIDNTWIQLRNNNDEIIYSNLMNSDDEYTYSIHDNYKITTGNAGSLIISIDGNIKGKLGAKGEIIESFVISSDFFN